MNNAIVASRSIKIIRWTARTWGIVVTILCLLMFFGSGSGGAGAPIASVDLFLLGLTGVAILGLFIAWRWELAGGILTIAMMFAREVAWVILKGQWFVAFLFLWLLIVPPAILFIMAWSNGRNERLPAHNKQNIDVG